MAEFNGFDFSPKETFWFDQSKESLLLSTINTHVSPEAIYAYAEFEGFTTTLLGKYVKG